MNVLKKHIIADQWSSHPWRGFFSWWSDESVCVCVCRPMSQTFPNPLPVKMHQLYNSGWFNLEKSCPQIQPLSISRNTWKPPLKSGASYQAYIVSGKVLNLTSAAIFWGWFLVSTTNNGDSRSVKSQGSLQRSARFRVSGAHTDATDVKGQVANEVEILRYPYWWTKCWRASVGR